MYIYAALLYYHRLRLIQDLLVRTPGHITYGLVDQAERIDHLALTSA